MLVEFSLAFKMKLERSVQMSTPLPDKNQSLRGLKWTLSLIALS